MDRSKEIEKQQMSAPSPKYKQVHSSLLQQFREGTYSPSEPLPGVRSLAMSMNVAVGTLRHALRQLEHDGFIRRVPGKGTYVNSPQQRREQVKSNAFSVIVPLIGEEPYPALVDGVEQAADGHYRITVGSARHDISQQERLIRQAIKDNVAGVAIVPTAYPTPPEHIRMVQDKHIPIVFCHRAVPGVEAPLVYSSFESAGIMAAKALLDRGHQRIASLLSMRYETTLSFSKGVYQTLEERGIDKSYYRVHYHGCMPKDFSEEMTNLLRDAIHDTLEQILNDENRPTAIFCGSSFEAELVYFIANDLGYNVPKDLSLIYFGSTQPRGVLAQRLTCVARDERELGAQVGRLLCEMSSGMLPHDSPKKIEIPLQLLPGQTVGPPP